MEEKEMNKVGKDNRVIEIEISGEDEDGDYTETVKFPAKFEICERCSGEGMITNPSIGAITGEEWRNEWSEEDRENYLGGMYDIVCPTCKGVRVLKVIDEEKCVGELLEKLRLHRVSCIELEKLDAIERMERMMGA
jgi:hypothetical protein